MTIIFCHVLHRKSYKVKRVFSLFILLFLWIYKFLRDNELSMGTKENV